MDYRYEDVTDDVKKVFKKVLKMDIFKNKALDQFNYKLVFDTKKRMVKGSLTLASIEAPSEKTQYLVDSMSGGDFIDLIIIIDNVVWDLADDFQKEAIVFHELKHVLVEEDNIKLVGHDIETFHDEISLCNNDLSWKTELAEKALSEYEDRKDKQSKLPI